MSYSPTSLATFSGNCPAALKFYAEQKERDEDVEFASGPFAEFGICFHACIHACALALKKGKTSSEAHKEMEAVALAMAAGGKCIAENAHAALEHADAFMEWWEFPPEFDYEHGVAFNVAWEKAGWDDPSRRLRLIFDAVGAIKVEMEDHSELKIAVGQDYKTGWGASRENLESIQMDAYLTALEILFGEQVDGLRIEIVSTRHHRAWGKTYIFSDDKDRAELNRRRARLEFTMKAADLSNGQPRIGFGCLLCRYTEDCLAFKAYTEHTMLGLAKGDLPKLALQYVVLKRNFEDAEEILKAATKASGPLQCEDGSIGYYPSERGTLKDSMAPLAVWLKTGQLEGLEQIHMESLRAFMEIMDPGKTQFDNVAKKCAKQLGFRSQSAGAAELGKEFIEVETSMRFGLQKK